MPRKALPRKACGERSENFCGATRRKSKAFLSPEEVDGVGDPEEAEGEEGVHGKKEQAEIGDRRGNGGGQGRRPGLDPPHRGGGEGTQARVKGRQIRPRRFPGTPL